jgi:ABC-2 type transport system permease protein
MATMAPSMPQFGLFAVPVYAIAYLLSGRPRHWKACRRRSRRWRCLPTTQFVTLSKAILYRGAGMDVIWPELALICGWGALFVTLAVQRFRAMLARQG